MKNLVTFLTITLLAASAWAFQAYNNTTDLKNFNKIQCDTNLTCSKNADKLKISLVGGKGTLVASTTATLTAAQCGSTIVSDSADVMKLPLGTGTTLGCTFVFVCGFAGNMDVNPDDADTIGIIHVITGTNTTVVLTPSAGDAIRCGAVGASIVLKNTAANKWTAIGAANGVWTDVN